MRLFDEYPKNLQDLPEDIRERLQAERAELHNKWKTNTSYNIMFTNVEGTRYFAAHRRCIGWYDLKGHSMPFGGGTYWEIQYGAIKWKMTRHPLYDNYHNFDDYDYDWMLSRQLFGKSTNGTIIPAKVGAKKEVLEIAKAIGTLDI